MNQLLIIVGLLFLSFSFLQINDPDSIFWILVYLIPSVLSFLSLTNINRKYFQLIGPIYLILSVYIYMMSVKTNKLYFLEETTSEFWGLILCSIWIFILLFIKNPKRKKVI